MSKEKIQNLKDMVQEYHFERKPPKVSMKMHQTPIRESGLGGKIVVRDNLVSFYRKKICPDFDRAG